MLFVKKCPDITISVSSFRKFRPKECVVIDSKTGIHNVCVCMIYQNVKLKFEGLTSELKKRNCIFRKTYHNALEEMVCSSPKSSCYFEECVKCPGVDWFCQKVEEILKDHAVSHVHYKEWCSVDR